jgi:5-methylcytosine-specific restriction enzyme A
MPETGDNRFGQQCVVPMAPPRACSTCGQTGCQRHRRPAWGHARPVSRIRGVPLQRLREQLFQEQPLCVHCLARGLDTVATIRDHITPLAEGGLDVEANTQALCASCHDEKTQREAQRGRQPDRRA